MVLGSLGKAAAVCGGNLVFIGITHRLNKGDLLLQGWFAIHLSNTFSSHCRTLVPFIRSHRKHTLALAVTRVREI